DPSSPPAGPASDAAPALHPLFAEEWDYRMEQNPTRASTLGDRRWNDRWPDLSLEAIEARHRHDRDALDRLARIDRERLSPEDRLNFDLFRKEYETDVEGHAFRRFLVPVNQRGGVQTADELADSLRFETLRDYEEWLARLESLPRYVEQTTELLR